MTKYHNKKTQGFDSKKEARRWEVLKQMESAGEIECLRKQVRYELIPTQRINGKCVERACTYIADFVYKENGTWVVEDCKGFRTDAYIIKRKLFLQKYGIRIKET